MATLEPRIEQTVHRAVEAYLAGQQPAPEGEIAFVTNSGHYQILDGVVFSASKSDVVGAELVGWLGEHAGQPTVEPAWSRGCRAVLVDRARRCRMIVTSTTRLAGDDAPLHGSAAPQPGSVSARFPLPRSSPPPALLRAAPAPVPVRRPLPTPTPPPRAAATLPLPHLPPPPRGALPSFPPPLPPRHAPVVAAAPGVPARLGPPPPPRRSATARPGPGHAERAAQPASAEWGWPPEADVRSSLRDWEAPGAAPSSPFPLLRSTGSRGTLLR